MAQPEPDAEGYIRIDWPSKSIPHGGVFHTPIAQPSEQGQKLLKLLLEESRLSVIQRCKGKWENELRLPDVPRTRSRSQCRQSQTWASRPKTSKRRSLSAIRESGAYESSGYRPLERAEDREEMKERLRRVMMYGDAEPLETKIQEKAFEKTNEVPTSKEMKNELLTQIRERVEWLSEMEYLGEGMAHREIIHNQIAQRMRALEALGLGSICDSARSTSSGFSVKDHSVRDVPASNRSNQSAKSRTSQRSNQSMKRQKDIEENVQDLIKCTPLKT